MPTIKSSAEIVEIIKFKRNDWFTNVYYHFRSLGFNSAKLKNEW